MLGPHPLLGSRLILGKSQNSTTPFSQILAGIGPEADCLLSASIGW